MVPVPAPPGYFTTPSTDADAALQSGMSPCPVGSFCVGGMRRLCPSGRYGDAFGLTLLSCAGPCAPGYYCPPNSTSAHQVSCGSVDMYVRHLQAHEVPAATSLGGVPHPLSFTSPVLTKSRLHSHFTMDLGHMLYIRLGSAICLSLFCSAPVLSCPAPVRSSILPAVVIKQRRIP